MVKYPGYNDKKKLINVFNEFNSLNDPLKEAEYIQEWLHTQGCIDDLVKHFCISKSTVYNRLALLKITEDVKTAMNSGRISPRGAARFGTLPKDIQNTALAEVLPKGKKRVSVREICKALAPYTQSNSRKPVRNYGRLKSAIDDLQADLDYVNNHVPAGSGLIKCVGSEEAAKMSGTSEWEDLATEQELRDYAQFLIDQLKSVTSVY